jgi:hypothetical protein
MLADEARGMGIVDHHQSVVAPRKLGDAVEGRDIAVHAEDAVGGDEPRAGILRGLQLRLQILHIGMAIAVALGLAEADAVDDGGMVEGVADDRILLLQQGLEEPAIGIEAGGIEDGIPHAEEAGDRASSALCKSWVPQMKRTEARPKP